MCFVWFINECVLIYIFLNFFGKINAYLAGHDWHPKNDNKI